MYENINGYRDQTSSSNSLFLSYIYHLVSVCYLYQGTLINNNGEYIHICPRETQLYVNFYVYNLMKTKRRNYFIFIQCIEAGKTYKLC